MSFDPYTNEDIHEVMMVDDHAFDAKEHFKLPVQCLLRIEKSMQLWNGEMGQNGYFIFIEEHIGQLVRRDEKTNFSFLIK